MKANKKDLRILKLLGKGLTPEQVARKIGCPADVVRVMQATERSAAEPSK